MGLKKTTDKILILARRRGMIPRMTRLRTSIRQLARMLGVGATTLRDWRNRGWFPFETIEQGRFALSPADLAALLISTQLTRAYVTSPENAAGCLQAIVEGLKKTARKPDMDVAVVVRPLPKRCAWKNESAVYIASKELVLEPLSPGERLLVIWIKPFVLAIEQLFANTRNPAEWTSLPRPKVEELIAA